MSPTPAQLEEILETFREVDDPEEYFELLIERGHALDELPPTERRADNRVPGCVSGVHITGRLEEGRVYFSASADSHLVRGLVAILVEGLSGLRPEKSSRSIRRCSSGPA
ncbi:MAG: SufE family protein [Acidobacteriota bacterium]|nr:SufE family protein [Acidobacteriota bacterium]